MFALGYCGDHPLRDSFPTHTRQIPLVGVALVEKEDCEEMKTCMSKRAGTRIVAALIFAKPVLFSRLTSSFWNYSGSQLTETRRVSAPCFLCCMTLTIL